VIDPQKMFHQLRRFYRRPHAEIFGAVERFPVAFGDEAAHGLAQYGHGGNVIGHCRQSLSSNRARTTPRAPRLGIAQRSLLLGRKGGNYSDSEASVNCKWYIVVDSVCSANTE